MLGLGSYTFRWSIGHKGLNPETPMSHVDLLDVAAGHGLGLVQFADNIPIEWLSSDSLRDLRDRSRDLGVAIELGTQAFKQDEMERYIGFSEYLDARVLRVALDGPDAAVPVPQMADAFRALLPRARQAGVRIAVENHFDYPARQLVELMDAIGDPAVGVCLDVANSICAGEWPMQTVTTLAPRTINLHLKDYDIVPDPYGVGFAIYGTPLGQGRTDCEAILDTLPKDRDINVILEHWLPREADMDRARAREFAWLAQSVAYARETLGL